MISKGKKQIKAALTLLAIGALAFLCPGWSDGQTVRTGEESQPCSDPSCRKIEQGDLVTIDYAVFTEDGKLIYSTRAKEAMDNTVPKAGGYREPVSPEPEKVVAGKAARIPGVGESLVGMAPEERKRIAIPPEKAFGPSSPQRIKTFPTTKNIDRVIRMSPQDYVGQFKSFPSVGKEVQVTPYVKARVSRVADTYAEVEVTNNDTEHFNEEFGSVRPAGRGIFSRSPYRRRLGRPSGPPPKREGSSPLTPHPSPLISTRPWPASL